MRTTPLLSVIVATIGRPTLARTLASLGGPETEVVVVADERAGALPKVFALTAGLGPRYRAIAHKSAACDWGNSGRNRGLDAVSGRYVAYLDDDDVWTPDAPERLYAALSAFPDAAHVFRMRYAGGRVLWADESLRLGNVGTPMVVLPRDLAQRARWGSEYEADYAYFRDAIGAATVVWQPDVIAEIRP